MATFQGIQNVLSRINMIQAKFKQPAMNPTMSAGAIPFDKNLKMAIGNQNFTPVSMNNGPENIQALLSQMGGFSGGVYGGAAGEQLSQFAKQWDGREFKAGQTARCADFVSTMVKQSGTAPKNFKHEVNCWELQKQGRTIEKKDLKKGDIVYFGYTYLPVDYTHVGIYIGDGKFVHRPTSDKPVRIDSIETGYYADKYSSARRLNG